MLVEDCGISGHISKADKFILQGPVESLVDRIVLRCFHSGPTVLKIELLARSLEVSVKFRSIVSLNILDFAVKQDIQAVEEITGGR